MGKGGHRNHKTTNIGKGGERRDYTVDEESGLKDGSSPPLNPGSVIHMNRVVVCDNANSSLIQNVGTVGTSRENRHPTPDVTYIALILNGLGIIQAEYGPSSCAEVKRIIKQLILNPSEPILPGNRYMAITGGDAVHLLVNSKNR